MPELIYFDVDGTLRDEVNGVSEKTKYAIEQCKEQNIRCVICTGRNMGSVQEDVKALPMDGLISGGGCYIQFHNKMLWESYFADSIVNKIVEISTEEDFLISLEAKNKIYMNRWAAEFYEKDFNRKIKSYCPQIQKEVYQQHKILFEDNIKDFQKEKTDIHKICIWGSESTTDRICTEFEENIEVIQKRKWNDSWYIELLPKNCNKGTAIKRLNQRLGIDKKDTMCFGDSENDIDMMKAVETAVAMRNSDMETKRYAASVCESVAEEGIYKELVRRKIIQDNYEEKERRSRNAKKVVAGRGCLSNLSEKLL